MSMVFIARRLAVILSACLIVVLSSRSAHGQQQTIAFSSVDSPNANWYIAKEKQLYKKYGLGVELIYIPSSTTTVAAVVGGFVAGGKNFGGGMCHAVGGRAPRRLRW